MKRLTADWVTKAEGDWTTALREHRARKAPNFDAACFHAQQCVEKYLKAQLQEVGIPFGKTHNLIAFLKLLSPISGDLEELRPGFQLLTQYAVEVRYPGESADKQMAREAVAACKLARAFARRALKLPD
jgi:HEPN domain-containing protein